MGNIFSGSEIVELGIQIERNGRDFYSALAARLKDPAVKEKFIYLAAEEGRHILAFQGILSSMARYEPAEAYPGEYFAYMNTLAGEYVFTQKDKGGQIAKTVKSEGEAVDMAMGFEKDSIVFYQGMKKVVPEDEQKVVEQLIAQEEDHLRQLAELKKKI